MLFFTSLFWFIYKMVDCEHSPDRYEPLKIRIEKIIKSPEMLRFVPDELNTK